MKILSTIFIILSLMPMLKGISEMILLKHEFGGEAYTNIISLEYAICYFFIGSFLFLLGFFFRYYSNEIKNKEIEEDKISEDIIKEDTNTYWYTSIDGRLRKVTPKTAEKAGWKLAEGQK